MKKHLLRTLIVAPLFAAVTASSSPIQLLPQDAAEQYANNCRRPNLFSALAATDAAPAGIRMQSEKRSDPIWNGGESAVATIAEVDEGDLLVLTVAVRGTSEKGNGDILAKLQGSDYVGVIRENISAPATWTWRRYVGTAKKNYEAGALRLHLYPGAARQVVEFRALSLENYGKINKAELPALPDASPLFGTAPIPNAPEPPKPITLAPLSADEKAIPRYVMLKLDDFNANRPAKGVHASYKRVADYLRSKGLKCGFGIVVNSLEQANNPEWIQWVKENSEDNGGLIEFWNHGWDHAMNFTFEGREKCHEYKGTSLAHQRDHMNRSQALVKEKTGLTMHSFGSAGNAFDASTSIVLAEHPEIEVWMYGNAKDPAGKLVLGRPMNLEYAVGKVSYQEFLKPYQSRRTSIRNGLVLQGHPNMWNDDIFAEFKKIVEQLEADGWTFTTPHEYYTQYRNAK